MSERETFERMMASLQETALDRARWSGASALIDEALGVHGNTMVFGDEDVRIYFAWICFRGERRRDLERLYYETYYHLDGRVPRVRCLPDG